MDELCTHKTLLAILKTMLNIPAPKSIKTYNRGIDLPDLE